MAGFGELLKVGETSILHSAESLPKFKLGTEQKDIHLNGVKEHDEAQIKALKEHGQFKDAEAIHISGDKATPVLSSKQLWDGAAHQGEGGKGTKAQAAWSYTAGATRALAGEAAKRPLVALGILGASATAIGLGAEHDKAKARQEGQMQGAQAAMQMGPAQAALQQPIY